MGKDAQDASLYKVPLDYTPSQVNNNLSSTYWKVGRPWREGAALLLGLLLGLGLLLAAYESWQLGPGAREEQATEPVRLREDWGGGGR